MRSISRLIAGLALVGSLSILSAAQPAHAAPATRSSARGYHGFHGHAGTHGRSGGPGRGQRGYGLVARGTLLTTLATACHTTTTALQSAMRSGGKTLLAICQSTNSGITETALTTTITNAYKAQLDASVKAGRITAGQESQILARMQTRIQTLLTTPLPARKSPAA